MTHDFKAAIEWVKQERQNHIENRGHYDLDFWLSRYDTIIHALRIADKLMQEPSDDMINSAYRSAYSDFEKHQLENSSNQVVEVTRVVNRCRLTFSAMRDQMLAELQLTESPENVSSADLTNAADTSQNIEHTGD
jgi:ABC-type Zn2+ transport system substrate-binding protein/surface adhesin